jgi:uncharacterized coiled-coil protein SlyX
VVTKGSARRGDETTEVWRQIGDLLVRGQAQTSARFDRLEGDVAVIKTDVAELKTDVAELKTDMAEVKTDVAGLTEKVDRLELAWERYAARVDAQFEQLRTFISRSLRKGS